MCDGGNSCFGACLSKALMTGFWVRKRASHSEQHELEKPSVFQNPEPLTTRAFGNPNSCTGTARCHRRTSRPFLKQISPNFLRAFNCWRRSVVLTMYKDLGVHICPRVFYSPPPMVMVGPSRLVVWAVCTPVPSRGWGRPSPPHHPCGLDPATSLCRPAFSV